MAEKLCSLRKKGGKMSETVLWTNPSPTSTFASQTVNLSQSIQNFKYIKFKYANNCYDTTVQSSVIISIEDWINNQSTSGCHIGLGSRGDIGSSVFYYLRFAYYASNTSITFDVGLQSRIGTTSSTENAAAIPLQIIGLK